GARGRDRQVQGRLEAGRSQGPLGARPPSAESAAMANLKEIRNRIGSVKSTRKITSAMSRIAAARLRRAQTAMDNARQYGVRMAGITGEILRELDDTSSQHPLLTRPPRQNAVAIIVVTADRGLCGGFNSAVNRKVERTVK